MRLKRVDNQKHYLILNLVLLLVRKLLEHLAKLGWRLRTKHQYFISVNFLMSMAVLRSSKRTSLFVETHMRILRDDETSG